MTKTQLLEKVCLMVEESSATAMYDLSEKIPDFARTDGLKLATEQLQSDFSKDGMMRAIPDSYRENKSVITITDAAYQVYQDQVNAGRNRFVSWLIACTILNRAMFELVFLKDLDTNWVFRLCKDAVERPFMFVLSSLVVGFLKTALLVTSANVVTSVAAIKTGWDIDEVRNAGRLTLVWIHITMTIANIKLLYKLKKRDPKQFELK